MLPELLADVILKSHYFWDVDVTALDTIKNRRLIIERILKFGSVDEIAKLTEFYGITSVVETCCILAYLDPKTMNFTALLFSIPKESFKCNHRKSLTQKHWHL